MQTKDYPVRYKCQKGKGQCTKTTPLELVIKAEVSNISANTLNT